MTSWIRKIYTVQTWPCFDAGLMKQHHSLHSQLAEYLVSLHMKTSSVGYHGGLVPPSGSYLLCQLIGSLIILGPIQCLGKNKWLWQSSPYFMDFNVVQINHLHSTKIFKNIFISQYFQMYLRRDYTKTNYVGDARIFEAGFANLSFVDFHRLPLFLSQNLLWTATK